MLRALLGARLATIPARHASAETAARLARLASDPEVLVRAAIAEAIKLCPDAPIPLVRRLAADHELSVAEVLLRCSPVLTESDLLALLAAPPRPETRTAIARRPGIGGPVVGMIIELGEPGPIAALLDNRLACINEAAFDRLLMAARNTPDLEQRLAARAELPEAIALALADSLEGHALVALARRGDLPRDTMRAVRGRIAVRLSQPASIDEAPEAGRARATLLHQMALLSESITWAAAQQLQTEFVAAALSLLSGVEPLVVDRIRQRVDRPAAAALAARAGLSAGCVEAIELALIAAEMPPPPRRRSRLGPPER